MRELEGVIAEIIFRNEGNGYTVFALEQGQDEYICTGTLPQVAIGLHVRLRGSESLHPEYGEQFRVQEFEETLPKERVGILRYLSSGLIRGIGPSTAERLLDFFGDDVLDVLGDAKKLVKVAGIGPKRAEEIAASYTEQAATRDAMLYLQRFDISPALALRIFRQYGDHTAQVIRENPYRLIYDIQQVGFKTADALAQSMGYAPHAESRLDAGLIFALNDAVYRQGHSYLPREALLSHAASLLDAPEELLDNALTRLLIRRELLAWPLADARGEAIYIPRLFAAESGTARLLSALRGEALEAPGDIDEKITAFEKAQDMEFHESQRHAITEAARQRLLVITGGPGTGKTTIIRCILRLLEGSGKTALAAPTGRAAKRMSQATGKEAKTIHRLLEYEPCDDGEHFTRDESNPLEADNLIIDEMSMVDIHLMHSLLLAVKPGSRLILVGDSHQLPSVGAGNVLQDILDAGTVPVARLTEIFRQALESMIVVNAHRVQQGELPLVNGQGSDFFLARSPRAGIAATVESLVAQRLPAFTGCDMFDIQVLSPMRKGEAGVFALNSRLQKALNGGKKPEIFLHGTLFRQGDKVMQIRNNYRLEWENESEEGQGVFNGDMGIVESVDKAGGQLTVCFDDGRKARYDEATAEELELAYCVSVHKSQGSEFPVVVLPLIYGPPMLYTRNLLYTAITRARETVVIVGDEGAIRRMVENDHIDKRYSALCERLQRRD